jgi:GR25 family glycosyltransferase involved in LPS biosynthesis
MLKSFIIHYTKLKERKEFMDYQLSKNPLIDYEYISEFDADDLAIDVIDKFYEKSPEIYKKKTENLWSRADSEYRELNLPEISCTLKHLEAIKRASKIDGISLILEDDCCFSDNFYVKLEKKISLLPDDWDAVFFGVGCGSWFQSQKIKGYKIVAENILKANHPSTNCAECYLVNQESAKRIYENFIPFHMISDWELAYIFYKLNMNVYWVYPSIAEQGSKNGMYRSTLDLGQR